MLIVKATQAIVTNAMRTDTDCIDVDARKGVEKVMLWNYNEGD